MPCPYNTLNTVTCKNFKAARCKRNWSLNKRNMASCCGAEAAKNSNSLRDALGGLLTAFRLLGGRNYHTGLSVAQRRVWAVRNAAGESRRLLYGPVAVSGGWVGWDATPAP